MHKKKRTKAKSHNQTLKNYVLKTAIGSAVGMGVFFLFALAAAFVLWKKDADTSSFKYVMFALAALSGFIGGFTAVRPVREKGLIFGALSALPTCVVLTAVSMLISKNGLAVTGWIFIVLDILFAAIGGIVAVNKRK
ncbi:MAG: TIGR04086 family membrane protein [Clostridia bacterium]|nr:TIGR04086 family membrane protein [Clostridia bacterium]